MRNTALFVALVSCEPAWADDPRIEAVRAHLGASGWSFDVTLSHADSGWGHYADGWRVIDMDGHEFGIRVLAHPHVNEQPFTRSLSGIQIPEGMTRVQLQARCNTDGWGAALFTVDLPQQ